MMMPNLQSIKFTAQLPTILDGGSSINTSGNDLSSLINAFLPVAVGIGISAAVVLVALGGYKMLTSSGDASKIKDAKEQIQNAIMGLILIIAAVSVSTLVMNTLGITGIL